MTNDFFRPHLIIGSLPVTLTNGTTADATQVMADLNYIVNQVNANAGTAASALTLAQLALATGSSLIGFLQAGVGAVSRTLQAKNRDVISIADYGTDADAAFAAAVTYAATVSGSVVIPAGTWVLTNPQTSPSNVRIDTTPGGILSPSAACPLTINGPIIASPFVPMFAGLGSIAISTAVNPVICADWFSSADMGVNINKAINAAGAVTPVKVTVGDIGATFATKINMNEAQSVQLCGIGPSLNAGATNLGPSIIWTGAAGSGNAISAKGAAGCGLKDLGISYNSAAYNNDLITLSSTGATRQTENFHVEGCRVGGTSAALSASRLISLDGTLGFKIEDSYLDYAARGISSAAGGNNEVTIGDGTKFGPHFTVAAVEPWGNAWSFGNFTYQAGASYKPFLQLPTGAGLAGGVFNGGFCVDGTVGGTYLDFSRGIVKGITFNGPNCSGSGTAIAFSTGLGSAIGITYNSGVLSMSNTGIDLGRADGVALLGGDLSGCSTPWTGTMPTRVFVGGLGTGMTNTSGIATGTGVEYALTPPGSSNSGAGPIEIYVTTSNDAAQVLLRGSLGSIVIRTNTSATFGNASGASTWNVYWQPAFPGGGAYVFQNNSGGNAVFVPNYGGAR